MFSKRDYDKISFRGVGLALIIFGVLICAIAFAAWFLSYFGYDDVFAFPFFKVIGGAIIIGLGYLVLEVELLRKK